MMLTLYQTPGACSLSPLIALHLANLPHTTETVDLRAHSLADGSDYYAVNAKGAVPALRLESGEMLTENAVLLQYICDQAPESDLIPAAGIERYRVLELINYVATEVHKGFSPLFNPATPAQMRAIIIGNLGKKFDYLAGLLVSRKFVVGDLMTAADAYLFTVLRWTVPMNIDLSPWPSLVSYRKRVGAEPAVQAALAEEGLRG